MAAIAEPFATGDSFLHRMDPRIRLICAAVFTIPVALLHVNRPAWVALVVGIVLIKLAKLNPLLVFKRLLAVNLFIAFLWLFLPFSVDGEVMRSIGPLDVTWQGVNMALLITIKSNAIVLSLLALVGTIPVQNLGPALQKLGVPSKLCHLLLFTYRYLFVIFDEYTTMRQAMRARGFAPRTDKRTYRTYAWLVGMLLVKSWDRAERVQNAMRCRGFRGRFYSLTEFTTRTDDYLFLILCLICTGAICYLGFIKGIIS